MSVAVQGVVCGSMLGRECLIPERGAVGRVDSVTSAGVVVASLGGSEVLTDVVAVPLPAVGEVVGIRGVDGAAARGYWVGLRAPLTPGSSGVVARLLVDGEVVERVVRPVELHAGETVVSDGSAEMWGAARALAAAYGLLDREQESHEVWKARLGDAACERADDQGWCSEFDDFMENWGLRTRQRMFDVLVDIRATVTIQVEASDSDAATGAVSHSEVVTALSYTTPEWEVVEVSATR